ncbi:MAG: hydroxyacid dehydrogenase [Reyranella sp.]|uniref:hydroxyacid dehydrogenase n=1 Tax=Reyranella sp. TaxID=1929291 RepID=UPI0011FC8F30|nr:hydroxyacid dehydrogenase [Reyranella sp.]TAJ40320.1 MAG: hydroxyacid dehydrogenase [Reyranella sp.]
MTTGPSTGKNRKKVLIVGRMPQAGLDVLKKRDDVDFEILADDTVPSLHPKLKDAHAVTLGGTPFRQAELTAAPEMMVVARLGVGFDAVEVPALNKRKIPLMTTGIANSVSVAEHAMYMLLASARLVKKYDRFVREGGWGERLADLPADLSGKSILVVGMGRIGSRTVKRCAAFEMDVFVLDPNISEAEIKKAGATKVTDLKAILPKVDFVSVHCPKAPETIDMFNSETLALMKPDAFLVNTARGGIINEDALYKALSTGKLRGAGLDVLDKEPPDASNKLFGLENVIFSPHMAGVTKEASDRMAVTAIENILSVFDGRPNAAHCVNKEVLK